jgi:DNA-binding SARP family transcriptional activator
MAHLSLSLLGPFQATLDGEPVNAFESDKVRALLAYLAVEADRPHSRDKLAGLLWPERPDRDARNNLRYALSNLRKAIGDQQAIPSFLHISHQTIQFNSESESWVDVTAFSNLLKSPAQTVRDLEEAVDLYRGEFLEGFSVGDSVPFEEWVLFKREQICRQELSALHRLAATYERRGEYGHALPYAWRQVELEPWQEKAHRQLMRLLALNGQRGAALAQYEACRRALVEELHVEPAQETTRLYAQIRDGRPGSGQVEDQTRAREAAHTPPASLPPAQHRLPGRRTVGVGLALIGSGLLLLVIATMQAIMFFGIASPERGIASPERPAPPPGNTVAPPEGKIVRLCEDVRPPQICVYETHTGQLTQVTDDLEFEEIDGLTWSPDGQQVVFDADPAPGSTQPRGRNLYIISADGSDLRQLTDGNTSDHIPVWSPDGEWIAFNRDRELWVIRPDGSEPHWLFGESDKLCVGELNWSPNGQQIAFVGHDCTTVPTTDEVWVINRDGTAPRVVHTFERQPDNADVFWDQAGREIVCARTYDGEGTRLLLIDADGVGEPYLIDELPFWWLPNYWPQWRREE